jgi:hypothetical protein
LSIPAADNGIDGKSRPLESLREQLAKIAIVFDNKQTHRATISALARPLTAP